MIFLTNSFSSAEERRYFEPFLANLLPHMIKLMKAYQAAEEEDDHND